MQSVTRTLVVTIFLSVTVSFPLSRWRSFVRRPQIPIYRPVRTPEWMRNITTAPCTAQPNYNMLTGRSGVIDRRWRWRSFNVIPDKAFNQRELQLIQNAMAILSEAVTCLDFGIWPPDGTPSGDYVYIKKGVGTGLCSSRIGRQGGMQVLNLDSYRCMKNEGTIMHEMIHALGFGHEHQRPDRDDHIIVLKQNVDPKWMRQFDKLPASIFTDFGIPYNVESIMHYGSYAFTKSYRAPTMLTAGGALIAGDEQLQESDIRQIQLMYGC